MTSREKALDARLVTGNPQLDQILDGGFPKNSINVVMGHPGTGKTIFVEQLLFHNATAERPALYLTTLSEPLSKVITYLQRFDFFDPREVGPSIIVIDSFKAIHDLTDSTAATRKMVWDLTGLLSSYDTTGFLVGEYSESQIPLYPEFAAADGIVEFTRLSSAKRDDRFVRVLKLRGSAYAEGFHAFSIGPGGLRVFPRLVSPVVPLSYKVSAERVKTGVEGLDRMLRGGLWRGCNTLITGAAGSGKTTLGLGFALEGIRSGEPTLFCSFQENPSQLVRTVGALGGTLEQLTKDGLTMLYSSPVEMQIDAIVVQMSELIREKAIKRVVIDSLGDLAVAADDITRLHDYLYALGQHFIVNGVTSIFTLETNVEGVRLDQYRLSAAFDAMIDLRVVLETPSHRTLRIVKARGIGHDLEPSRMTIDWQGLHVDPETEV